ncbi:DNA-directed RNA polymerase subunit D [Candidatus Woesearchaeota archaeon]|nr:DNA-directed RNA polymerase subunit D [Candidatus Woesearchaeota archaeon]
MDIEVLDFDRKVNRLVFAARDTTGAFVNALRRTVANEVPVMAVEDVEVRKNSSVLYDEVIAHRLGLVPLKTDLESYTLPEECKCGGAGCARCQAKLTLVADDAGIVYSEMMKPKDPKVKPVFSGMPIVKLLKGQKLEVEVTAVLGKGKAHVKWKPGLLYYKHYPVIRMSGEIKDASLVERFPDVFEQKGGRVVVKEAGFAKSHLTDSIDELSGGAVSVQEKEDDFVVYLESWGQLDCKEILESAVKILDAKLDSFKEELTRKA